MNKTLLYNIFLLFTVFSLKAQENLVPNGSFEEYYSCPVSNDLNNDQLELVKGWWKPTLGTSDYFNRCNTGIVGVPNNFWGYQEAYNGDGYVGMVPISINSMGSIDGYEYIQTQLITFLKPCHEYYFSMYVSMANHSTHSLGRLGASFSIDTNFNNLNNWDIINVYPQVVNNTGPIGDSINWVKIEGTFIADGFENFLTIGYFYNNVTNDSIFIKYLPSSPGQLAPYYYIDNITLYELEEIKSCQFKGVDFPNVFTPNNDGINDFISMTNYSFVEEIHILNRWGNNIIKLNKDQLIWDGRECSEGVYYYIIKFKDYNKQQTGFIHLIR